MANAPKRSAAAANAACDPMCALMNTGSLIIYGTSATGTPSAVSVSITDQPSLAALTMSSTAFGAASNGVATANTITGTNVGANGTASFFRITTFGGTAVLQGTCGTASADMILNTVVFVVGAAVSITSLTVTESLG